MTQNVQGWTTRKRRTFIVVGLLVASTYVGGALLTDSAQLGDALRRLGLSGSAAVLGLSGVNYLLRFFRWQYYLAKLDRVLPIGRHLLVYLSGFAFTVSPAKAGEAVRSLYLRDHGVTYTDSIAALFAERLLDLCAVAVLASLTVIDHQAYRLLFVVAIAVLTMVLSGVCQPIVPLLLERFAARFGRRVGRGVNALANLLRTSRRLLHPRFLLLGIVLGLAAWVAEGVGFGLVCTGLHIDGSMISFVGIYAVAVLAGTAVFLLPAGIGGMELVMTTLLVEQGAPLRTAIVATLLCRLATLWFAVIIGVAAAAAVEMSERPLRAGVAP